jgi:hypothetical protein
MRAAQLISSFREVPALSLAQPAESLAARETRDPGTERVG